MTLQSLLSDLRAHKVSIWLEGDKLKYRTAEGSLSPGLRARIKAFRTELIDMAQCVESDVDQAAPFTPVSRSERLPLSYAEERLWFLSSLSPDTPVFQLTFAYELIGQISVSALEQCFAHLVSKHELLRTRYSKRYGYLRRDIGHESDVQLRVIHADSAVASTRVDAVTQYVGHAQCRKLNLGREFAFQPSLLKLSDNTHVLVVTLHHIIYDDQSLRLLWRELSDTYNALASGNELPSAEQALQYADIAHWQRSNTDEHMQAGIQYWQHKLADIPRKIDLPTDHPRSLHQRFSGQRLTRRLTKSQRKDLQHLCREHKLTKYMALLAIFSVLMHRYSRQSTVLVGSPVSSRRRWPDESMLGCFIDTIVLRTDFDGTLTTNELFRSVKQTTLEAFDHQHVPFEKVVEAIKPERNSGFHPIFQVMFNFLSRREEQVGPHLDGLSVSRVGKSDTADIAAEFDINFIVIEQSDELTINVTYDCDLFQRETLDRMTDHFICLLESAASNPQMPVRQLPMLTRREQTMMLRDWNATQHSYRSDYSVCDLFEQQVLASPDSIALIDHDRQITYRELNRRSNQLAWHLRYLGVESQAVVGVHLDRSTEVTIALLAILKINAVYLPLDTSYPLVRLQWMLESSNASCLLDRSDARESIDFSRGVRISMDTLSFQENGCYENVAIDCAPDDIAYIVYTSGSTGVPKAVHAPHRQLLNRLHWMWRQYPLSSNDVSCQKTAISFIDSLWELLGPLLQGSPSVIINGHMIRDPKAFLKKLDDEKVTRLWVVPTLLELLLDAAEKNKLSVPSLEFVVASGESLPVSLVVKLHRLWPQVSLYNVYGTSESWDSSWYSVIDETLALTSQWVPIGKPIDNTQLYILDELMNPVPAGVTGQLYVGGHGLPARIVEGSSNENERFGVLPWQPEQHVLALGDLARFRQDGTIELVGRESQIINVRGYRVEPAEVEHALRNIPGISKAVVVQTSLSSRTLIMVACLVLSPGLSELSRDDEKRIKNELKRALPAYMIPDRFHCLAQFPLTPTGKIDRSKLALLAVTQAADARPAGVQPNTQTQADVLAIWKKVLAREDIEIDDDFFDMGGHSMLAVALFHELSRLAGSDMEMTTLFHASTVIEQAHLIDDLINEQSSETLVTVQTGCSGIPLFMIPPSAGTGLNYRRLFKTLGVKQPLYTFDLTKSAATPEAQGSIEDMASRYIREMRQIQSEGPYLVGGMCFGAIIAWEMAQQLQQSRSELGCIILLDASLPGFGPIWANPPPSRVPSIARLHNDVLNLLKPEFSRQGRRRVVKKLISRVFRRWNSQFRHYAQLKQWNLQAQQSYTAVESHANVLLICSGTFSSREHYLERWRSLVRGKLEMVVFDDATHIEMLVDGSQYVEPMSKAVREYLDRMVYEQ